MYLILRVIVFWLKLFYHWAMNSHLLSVGKFFLTLSLVASSVVSCVQPPPAPPKSPEVSLTPEQAKIEAMRQKIPPEKRKANDELKVILGLMKDQNEPPDKVRDRFQTLMRRQRDEYRKSTSQSREEYSRKEKSKREQILRNFKAEREKFKKTKADRDSSREFYDRQEESRRQYFADERDRRRNFESDQSQKSKDFESDMREKQHNFDQELKFYRDRMRDAQKAAQDAKNPPTQQNETETNDRYICEADSDCRCRKFESGKFLEGWAPSKCCVSGLSCTDSSGAQIQYGHCMNCIYE
jgi:hypothetical protein